VRIVAAAAALVAERGVAATSLDDVRALTRTCKSQLYHYFGDKQGLVEAVVQHTSGAVLDPQAEMLSAVETWDDLDAWCQMMVDGIETGMQGGCPIGTWRRHWPTQILPRVSAWPLRSDGGTATSEVRSSNCARTVGCRQTLNSTRWQPACLPLSRVARCSQKRSAPASRYG
jgi:AcrR family transcriptional regulator